MKIEGYVTVVGETLMALDRNVNEFKTIGYVPVGGPFVSAWHKRKDGGMIAWQYVQAMVLRDEPAGKPQEAEE